MVDNREISSLVSLKGRVAIVTGAASGIGFATAKLLSSVGCDVAMIDIDGNVGLEREREIKIFGTRIKFYACDVSNGKNVRETIDDIYRDFRGIDILINAAGIIVRKGITEISEEEWERVIEVDLKGVFLLSHHAVPYMKKGGSIINIGSGWGLKGGPKAVAYCAAKGGVVNMTRAMAIDLGPREIRVNCINPGDVETPLLRGEAVQLGEDINRFMKEAADRPIKRVGQPSDIANAVLYLASDLSSWVTGANITVDGGGLA